MSAESKIEELKLELPPAPKPVGAYKPVVIVDKLVYLSGHLPLCSDGSLITGRLGDGMDVDAGYAAARQVGLAMLASLRESLGSLDKVGRVVKLLGMVSATSDFIDHPKVVNGCSELFADVWGPDRGVGARSAVGVASLPAGIAVEIEAIYELA